MFDRNRIRTPWKHRWRRFRYSLLPVLSFVLCIVLTVWMWGRQVRFATAVGQIERLRVDVVSALDGRLVSLDQPYWQLFDRVRENQLVAQLDDAPARVALEEAQLEIERLRKEIDAARAQVALTQLGREQDQQRERTRLVLQAEGLELDGLDRRAQIAEQRAALQRAKFRVQEFEKSLQLAESATTRQQLADAKAERDVITSRIDGNEAALRELEAQKKIAEERLAEFPATPPSPDVAAIVAPIQAAIAAQHSVVRQQELRIKSLDIKAPITGTIAAIYFRPGQNVQAGEPILTIAAETGDSIVGYIRQDSKFRPSVGMEVEVRARTGDQPPAVTQVERVGPQFEVGPTELRRDPRQPEWVLPIRIARPPNLLARPGEAVDLSFKLVPTHRPG